MSIDDAFKQGMKLSRDAGLNITGKEIAVIAAENGFRRQATKVQHDQRFPIDGPLQAEKLIIAALAL